MSNERIRAHPIATRRRAKLPIANEPMATAPNANAPAARAPIANAPTALLFTLTRSTGPALSPESFNIDYFLIFFIYRFAEDGHVRRAAALLHGLWPGEQFEQMAVRVAEVDATATIPVIKLSVFRIPWMAAVRQPGLSHSVENSVKLAITHLKCIVMGLKRIIFVKIECQSVVHVHGNEMSGRTSILKTEDIGKKARRLFFVMRRHNCMIKFYGHESLPMGIT